jgi:serine/threonine protein kinase
MIRAGKIVKSDSGRRVRVKALIKAGGQGEAYWAREVNSAQKGVLKIFHDRFVNDDTVKRIQFLVGEDLHSACPVLCAPIDPVMNRDLVGHFAPVAEGIPLEEFLKSPNSTFIEEMQLAITLAHAISVIHNRHIAHGDLHAENLIINRVGSVFHLSVIDFDNFSSPGMPAPPCVGHNLYMAPELRVALAKGLPAIPSVETDLFSLGVLMHEIILLRHVCAGNDDNESSFQKAMCSGRWLHDPAAADRPKSDLGGFPVDVLNANLARLFRSALSLDPLQRPSADAWEIELGVAFNSVYCCPGCGGPCIIDVSKTTCPLCGRPFPHPTLRVNGSGRCLPLANGATMIGRAQLGGSMKVSTRHAVFRRVGPETWLESVGSNGTYRWNGTAWTRLPDKQPRLIQHGDRLRLGDVEIDVA